MRYTVKLCKSNDRPGYRSSAAIASFQCAEDAGEFITHLRGCEFDVTDGRWKPRREYDFSQWYEVVDGLG